MIAAGTTDPPTPDNRTLVVEREFRHPPGRLWRALTEGPLLARWMMSNDFEPVVGRGFRLRAEPREGWNGVVDCEVLEVDPLRRLSYSWSPGGGLRWIVVLTLTPIEGGGTRLRMEQSGFGPGQEGNYAGAGYGWNRFLGALERLLADEF